jgi:hypothetical protein
MKFILVALDPEASLNKGKLRNFKQQASEHTYKRLMINDAVDATVASIFSYCSHTRESFYFSISP